MKSLKSSKGTSNRMGRSNTKKVSNLKQRVYTLQDGKLIVSPDEHLASNDLTTISVSNTKPGSGIADGDEIHIEIFRENDLLPCSIPIDYEITNISSAYQAFWKTDFKDCIDRRTCLKCKQIFLTPQKLLHHWQHVHQLPIPEECFVCHKIFGERLLRDQHLLKTHQINTPDWTCEVCFQVFTSETDKNMHMLMHSASHKCKWCSMPFPCKYFLDNHLPQCPLRKTDQDCNICGSQFGSSQMQSLHSLRHNRITCEICHFNLLSAPEVHLEGTEITYIRHLKNIHSTLEIKNYLQALKKQDEDEIELDKLLLSHVQTNSPLQNNSHLFSNNQIPTDQPLPVNIAPNQLRGDANIETSGLSLQCSECLKCFESKEELIKHDVEHQLPFSCHICKQNFSVHRAFKAHMRCHGVKVKRDFVRYKCKHCSVSCHTLSNFRIHLLTHTNQKLHLCEKCGLKFRRPNALRLHEQRVHESRHLDSCPYCGMSSFSKKSLLRHILCVHEGVRRFICGLCAFRCIQNQDLRRHLKSVHQVDVPPLKSTMKKSNKQVHVIPSAESLQSSDPLADLLKFAIQEEQSKLEAIRQRTENTSRSDNNTYVLRSESCVEEGQSLNILGDVASKAAPLEHANTTSDSLKNCTDLKFKETIKYFCVGCQQACDSLQSISAHLVQCQHGKNFLPSPEKCLNDVSTANSLSSFSLQSTSSNVPCQFYYLPTPNSTSDLQLELSLMANNYNSLTCPLMPSLNVVSSCTIMPGDNGPGEKVADKQPSSVLGAPILTTSLPQVDFLCPPTVTFQEELLAGVEREADDLDRAGLNPQDQHGCYENQAVPRAEKSLISHESMKMSCLVQSTNAVPTNIQHMVQLEKLQDLDQNSESISLYGSSENVAGSQQDFPNVRIPHNENIVKPVLFEKEINLTSQIAVEKVLGDKVSLYKSTRSAEDLHAIKLSSDMKNCPVCKKEFSNYRSLQRHVAAHSGGKEHECTYCGKNFQYKFNLTVHLRCHSGERPYRCSVCMKHFRYLAEMNEHKLMHENSHPFKCEMCEEKFTRKRDLRRHSYSHNQNSKRHTCHICQKSYSRTEYLKRHIREHKKLGDIENCATVKEPIGTEPEGNLEFSGRRGPLKDPSSTQATTTSNHQNIGTSFNSDSKTNQDLSDNSSTVASNSDNLISLAYQAAEDGVEFTFVEEINNLGHYSTNEISTNSNVIYVQVIETDDSNVVS